MPDTPLQEKLKSFFEKMLQIAGLDFEKINCYETQPEVFRCDVFSEEAGILIGEAGNYLASWEQILKAYGSKLAGKAIQVIVDINNYRSQKDEELKEMAKRAARQAVLSKKPVPLPAMNSYERKVVHLELALRPDVTTESEGEEPERHVVVKPI
jgi:spoIIIJ-associated protein